MPNGNNIPIKCIIVDDEPMARDIIRRYIEQVASLQLMGEFGNAIDATVFLQDQSVDIIFLDIRMPQLTGTEFVRSLRHMPRIIFTTAHKEYAHEGYELDVVDYLLKPIRFDRFLKSVNKAFPPKQAEPEISALAIKEESKTESPFIYLRVDRKMTKVMLDDVLYIESDKDYVKLYTCNSYVITRQTIAAVEAMLSESKFARIHRSYIVSLGKIKSFTHDTVEVGNKELPVGKLYRNHFVKRQGEHNSANRSAI
jgi:two-component system, LytTR family, response regulator